MFGGGIEMPTELRNTDYDRTSGLLVTLDSNNHNVTSPGGMQFPDGVFSFIGDNAAKGISDAPALTFHANPEWSLANFDKTNREIHDELLEAATPWLGSAQVTSSEMKKWRFAIPKKLWPDACWVDDSGTLAIAGDAFAGPRVEGAALSGLAAARALLA